MRYHNHNIFRFLIDLLQIFILFLLLLSPIFMVTSLKFKDFNFKAEIIKNVAGVKTSN
jgi:hypothetical protein